MSFKQFTQLVIETAFQALKYTSVKWKFQLPLRTLCLCQIWLTRREEHVIIRIHLNILTKNISRI